MISTGNWKHVEWSERSQPVQGVEPAGQLQGTIGTVPGENILETPTTTPSSLFVDSSGLLRAVRGALEESHVLGKVSDTAKKVGNFFLQLVLDPDYLNTKRSASSSRASQLSTRSVDTSQEQARSREAWTTLTFQSASKVQPHYHRDGSGNNDRVLNDAEHGIFGVFDGIGGSKDPTGAAELVRDTVWQSLLSARKPTSIDEARQLMLDAFIKAREECKRLKIDGGTTANVSYAVEIDGRDYLIVGNAGDSVCYQTDAGETRRVTTEQLYKPDPKRIFNAVSSERNYANDLTDDEILRQFTITPKLKQIQIDPALLRDEVVVVELKPGMRFVHVSDGIAGDKPYERVGRTTFARALASRSPQAVLNYLFNVSIKQDDKSGVSFFAEAA